MLTKNKKLRLQTEKLNKVTKVCHSQTDKIKNNQLLLTNLKLRSENDLLFDFGIPVDS